MCNRVTFGVMCMVFNPLGVPCFMQGRIKLGIKRLMLSLFTIGIGFMINFIKGIILGARILKMSDQDFARNKYNLSSGAPRLKEKDFFVCTIDMPSNESIKEVNED